MLTVKNLDKISGQDQYLGEALRSIQEAINQGFTKVGVDPTGNFTTPPAIQGFVVNAANGSFAGTISDSSPIYRPIHYFVEWSTDPQFTNPVGRMIYLGPARDFHVFLGNVTAYFRAYSMYFGSQSASPIIYASTNPVTGGGVAAPTFPPSGGAGTASGNGQQNGTGFGPNQYRYPPTNPGLNPRGRVFPQ